MYSVVLLAALTTGSATPNWHGYGGGCGCDGGFFDDGYGGYAGGYSDGDGGYGYWGGYNWGYGDVFQPDTVAPGVFGGTGGTVVPGTGTNGGGYSAGGGGYGYWGGYSWGYGDVSQPDTVAPGVYGGTGGTVVPGTGTNGGYSDGDDGYWGGYGDVSHPGTVAPGVYGVMGRTVVPGTGTRGEALSQPKPNKSDNKGTTGPTHATLVVEVPANATLFIDNMPVKATAGVQTFHTPALKPGQQYFYLVRIKSRRNGQPVSETRRIIVRAGQVTRADFNKVASEAVRTTQAK